MGCLFSFILGACIVSCSKSPRETKNTRAVNMEAPRTPGAVRYGLIEIGRLQNILRVGSLTTQKC